MSRRAHIDGEQRPPPDVLVALGRWLEANGLRRVALVKPLGTQQVHVSRMFAGTAYLSATQRQAIEGFTEGAITAAMLAGMAPPSKVEAKRSAPVEPPVTSTVRRAPTQEHDAGSGSAPRPPTQEEVDRIIDALATKAMPAAFKVITEQMMKGKSESEKRRCAEILIEHLRGKAKQYEKREQLVQPVSDEALLRKLREIEANLTGLPVDEYGRVIRPPQAGAAKDPA